VVFARQAGEHGTRALALAPALGETEEASSEQVGGEVLVGDRDLADLPSLSDSVEVRKYDVLQDRLDGVGGKEPVERGVGSLLIQPVEGCGEVAGLAVQDGGRRRDRSGYWFAAAEQ
jgi:hypothetical protein